MFFHFSVVLGHPEINEVMYNSPDGNEWFELYNPHPDIINLSFWNVSDTKETDALVCCSSMLLCSFILYPSQYVVVVDQDSTLPLSAANVSFLCVDDNALGNGLSNSGETLTIFNASKMDSITYSPSMGADGNNKTLERTKQNTFLESLVGGGTPGRENSVDQTGELYTPLIISEIYPNPIGEDDQLKPLGEWIELYNGGDTEIDLSTFYFKDSKNESKLPITHSTVDDLLGVVICPRCYKLIYRNKDTDFSLNNDEDRVELYHDAVIVQSLSYSSTLEGMSWSNNNGIWYLTAPTPGAANSFIEECDWQLLLSVSEMVVTNPENFSFSMTVERLVGKTQNITVRGSIFDVRGNEVSSYAPWTQKLISQKNSISYSPNLKPGVYKFLFHIENLSCPDLNLKNNNISSLVAVPVPPASNQSSIILVVKKTAFQWGDIVPLTLQVYNGNEDKQIVKVWIERDSTKIAPVQSFTLPTPFENYTFSLSLLLDPNCDEQFSDGEATVVVKGEALRQEAIITIEGIDTNDCTLEVIEQQGESVPLLQFEVLSVPASIYSGDILRVPVQIKNDKKPHRYTSWGYLYKGKTCYSCQNQTIFNNASSQTFAVGPYETIIPELLIITDFFLTPGEYSLKIKIKKDGQKTTHDLTKKIIVQPKPVIASPMVSQSAALFSLPESFDMGRSSSHYSLLNEPIHATGITVYESNTQKTKALLPYFLLMAFVLLGGIILFKK